MKIKHYFKKYLIILFIFGIIQYPFPTIASRNIYYKLFLKVLQQLPTIILIVLNIFAISNEIIDFNFARHNNKDDIIVTMSMVNGLLILSINVTIVISNIYHQNNYKNILNNLLHLEEFALIKFNVPFTFKKLSNHVRNKIFLVLLVNTIISMFNLIVFSHNVITAISTVAMIIVQNLVYLSCFNAIICLDAMNFMLKQICKQFANKNELKLTLTTLQHNFETSDNNNNLFKMIEHLQLMKYFYFIIWKCICNVNKYFGWTFLISLFHMFLEFTFSGYWVFLVYQENSTFYEFLRKIHNSF